MSRTFIPRALAAGCKLVPNIRARRLKRRGAAGSSTPSGCCRTGGGRRHRLRCKTLFVCCGAIQTPALLQASGIAPLAGRSLRMHPTVKVVARFPEAINSREMGVPVHQVKEFSPRLSFGCSISGVPYLSLAMLDHPKHAREVDDGWPRMAIYYAMIAGGSGSVRRVPGYRDPLVRFALGDEDMRDLADGTRKLSELLFAAGAEALYPTVDGAVPLAGIDDLGKVADPLPQGRTSLMTIHLFSSVPHGRGQAPLRGEFVRPRARARRSLHRRRQPPVHGPRRQPAGLDHGLRPPQRLAFSGSAMSDATRHRHHRHPGRAMRAKGEQRSDPGCS